MDIHGIPDRCLKAGDSIPGQIQMSPGGVGRNIAENLTHLGASVSLMTALGKDSIGRVLTEECRDLGMDLRFTLYPEEGKSSIYLAVLDEKREMAAAISDMNILTCFTPESLDQIKPFLNEFCLMICDANLPEETLKALAEIKERPPLYIDPVSEFKAKKLIPLLSSIHGLKPNLQEMEVLTGRSLVSETESGNLSPLRSAGKKLLEKGVQKLAVSLGSRGIYFLSDGEEGIISPPKMNPASVTGAGDAAAAALVLGLSEQKSLKTSTEMAVAASLIALESEKTISALMNRSLLKEYQKELTYEPIS